MIVDEVIVTYCDDVVLHAGGVRYIYKVRSNKLVKPVDRTVFQHETYDWITLLTCRGFEEATGEYRWRQAVRAVLVRVIE